jgi:hypothetical protein
MIVGSVQKAARFVRICAQPVIKVQFSGAFAARVW